MTAKLKWSAKLRSSAAMKSGGVLLVLMVGFGVGYESSLRRMFDSGQEWLRRQGPGFCQPGYRLYNEHVWREPEGETYFFYVFESTPLNRGIGPGYQILVEDAEHRELDRVSFRTDTRLHRSAFLATVQPRFLEIITTDRVTNHVSEVYRWRLEKGKLQQFDLETRRPVTLELGVANGPADPSKHDIARLRC